MIYVAYGANLPGKFGRPHETFHAAERALRENGVEVQRRSSLWETSPVGTPDAQPWYTNAVWRVDTDLAPGDFLALLLGIEESFGRTRSFRNAAKSIDLDLIAYHSLVIEDAPGLLVPHPRLHERAFVLKPLEEVAPDFRHPVSGRTVTEMLGHIPADQQFRKVA